MSTLPSIPRKTAPFNKFSAMVLLVDDQEMVGEAIRRILFDEPDVDFHFCSDAKEALALAESIRPTVILQDLVMPSVDGLQMVRLYRANPATKDIPIIVLSTREEPKVKAEAFAAGANDYLVKLPDRIELIARILYHSKAYLSLLQRDEAFRALHESQQKLMEANIQLQRMMNMDGLTGLNNRRCFDEYAATEWSRAAREQSAISLLMIDVDYFKKYNDTYGHLAGDEVLKKIAQTIQKSTQRPADLAARFGGEEFVIVLPATPLDGARHLAQIIHGAVEALNIPHAASAITDHATVSIGGASVIPKPGDALVNLLETADSGLYEAKRKGRNQIVMCE